MSRHASESPAAPSSDRAILLLSIGAFGSSASLRVADPVLPLLANDFGTTPGGAAAVIIGFSIAYGLLQAIHGPLGDRVGKYRLVVITTAISALATLACGLAPNLQTLVAMRFLAGATVGALIPLAMAWIGDVVPYERRQPVLARFLIGQMVGMAFGTAVSGLLGEHFGWRAVFWLLGGQYVVLAVLLHLEVRRNPLTRVQSENSNASVLAGVRGMAGLIRLPWVRVVAVTAYLEGMLFYGAMAFAALYLHQRFGLGLGAAGSMVAVFALGGIAYALLSRRLLANLGERGLVLWGGVLMSSAFVCVVLAPSAWWTVPAFIVSGAGIYMMHNTLQVNATQMAPHSRGAGVSTFAFCLFSGQSTGAWLGAKVVDAWGARPLFLFSAGALMMLALAFRWFLQRRLRKN